MDGWFEDATEVEKKTPVEKNQSINQSVRLRRHGSSLQIITLIIILLKNPVSAGEIKTINTKAPRWKNKRSARDKEKVK